MFGTRAGRLSYRNEGGSPPDCASQSVGLRPLLPCKSMGVGFFYTVASANLDTRLT